MNMNLWLRCAALAICCGAVIGAQSHAAEEATATAQSQPAPATAATREQPPVAPAELGKTVNVHTCGSLYLAGQPTEGDIDQLKAAGIRRVITLRAAGEIDWDEAAKMQAAELDFVQIPFRSPDSLTDDLLGQIRQLLRESRETPTMLHCGSANRVGAVWLTHRVLDQGVPVEQAIAEAKEIGLRAPELEQKALDYIARNSTPPAGSTSPGAAASLNAQFLDPDLNVDEWVKRFEVESREIYAAREEVLKACELQAGWHVADIGAGTGLYTHLFSRAVGDQGWVYAVDISSKFLAHINEQVAQHSNPNVTCILGGQQSTHLPSNSIDLAFICDTYHHFEYPRATMDSIHRALRPGGVLVVVDFERIPGQSRDWVLTHVRAGRAEVLDEIQAAGFELMAAPQIPAFQENYLLKFRKK